MKITLFILFVLSLSIFAGVADNQLRTKSAPLLVIPRLYTLAPETPGMQTSQIFPITGAPCTYLEVFRNGIKQYSNTDFNLIASADGMSQSVMFINSVQALDTVETVCFK